MIHFDHIEIHVRDAKEYIEFLPSADYLKNTETGFREILGRIFYTIKG